MIVGIPRALMYFEYEPLWERWIRGLGHTVVVSPYTTKACLTNGIELAPEEACLPLKAYLGHVKHLSTCVDRVFVPRVVATGRHQHSCPKIIALPDIVKSLFPGILLEPLWSVESSPCSVGSMLTAVNWGTRLCGSSLQSFAAYWQGVSQWKRKRGSTAHTRPERTKLKVAVVGHRYITCDPFLSQQVTTSLARMGVYVLPQPALGAMARTSRLLGKRVYWHHESQLVSQALHYLSGAVHGVIHLSCFGCGPDSMISDLLAQWARRHSKVPFLTLNLDEHSSEVGLATRLEAFVDIVEAAANENHLSSHR
ncbi:MAG: acyl-CoA dehydratase activase-related protein [Bacillota bacterium]